MEQVRTWQRCNAAARTCELTPTHTMTSRATRLHTPGWGSMSCRLFAKLRSWCCLGWYKTCGVSRNEARKVRHVLKCAVTAYSAVSCSQSCVTLLTLTCAALAEARLSDGDAASGVTNGESASEFAATVRERFGPSSQFAVAVQECQALLQSCKVSPFPCQLAQVTIHRLLLHGSRMRVLSCGHCLGSTIAIALRTPRSHSPRSWTCWQQ